MPIIGAEPIPIVLVEGDARARGRQHGELTRARVKQTIDCYMERFSHFAGLSPGEARSRAEQYSDPIREYDPHMLEEITGIAEGAGRDVRDVLAINCRSELLFGSGSAAECTSFGLQPEVTGNGHTYVGQNWDWAADVRGTLILLVINQEPRPTVVLLDEAGMIGRMGMNSAGIAVATNTLIAEGRQRVVGHADTAVARRSQRQQHVRGYWRARSPSTGARRQLPPRRWRRPGARY